MILSPKISQAAARSQEARKSSFLLENRPPPGRLLRTKGTIDFAHGAGHIDRVKGVGLYVFRLLDHIVLLFPQTHHVEHGDRTGQPLALKGGHRMPAFPDFLGNFLAALRADDPQDDVPEGDSLLKKDADHVACGKTQGVKNAENGSFRDTVDDGGYDDQPHADLHEPEEERDPCPALHNADGPHGPHGDISDSC